MAVLVGVGVAWLHVNEATKYVGELEREGRVVLEAHYGVPYYRAREGSGGDTCPSTSLGVP